MVHPRPVIVTSPFYLFLFVYIEILLYRGQVTWVKSRLYRGTLFSDSLNRQTVGLPSCFGCVSIVKKVASSAFLSLWLGTKKNKQHLEFFVLFYSFIFRKNAFELGFMCMVQIWNFYEAIFHLCILLFQSVSVRTMLNTTFWGQPCPRNLQLDQACLEVHSSIPHKIDLWHQYIECSAVCI